MHASYDINFKAPLVAISDVTERVLSERKMPTAHSKTATNLAQAETSLRESEV
jgi:hypothetical protein